MGFLLKLSVKLIEFEQKRQENRDIAGTYIPRSVGVAEIGVELGGKCTRRDITNAQLQGIGIGQTCGCVVVVQYLVEQLRLVQVYGAELTGFIQQADLQQHVFSSKRPGAVAQQA